MTVEKRKYRDFYENHVLYGAKHCDLEESQWGVNSEDPFRRRHGQTLTNEVVRQVISRGGRILDVGCGQGHILSQVFSSVDEAIGIDVSRARVHQSTQRLSKLRGIFSILLADAERLPFVEDHFDVVLSTEVIEHVLDDRQMLHEIFRVLKPIGILILSTPNAWNFDNLCFFIFNLLKGKRLTLSGDLSQNLLIEEHIRFFDIFLLRMTLKECGFRILKRIGVGFRLPPVLSRRLIECPFLSLLVCKGFLPLGRLIPIFSQTLLVVATKA